MRAYMMTSFDMDFKDKYYRLTFGSNSTFDEIQEVLDEFKREVDKFKVQQEEAFAKQEAEKAAASTTTPVEPAAIEPELVN
jgi:hypothetical protein